MQTAKPPHQPKRRAKKSSPQGNRKPTEQSETPKASPLLISARQPPKQAHNQAMPPLFDVSKPAKPINPEIFAFNTSHFRITNNATIKRDHNKNFDQSKNK